MKSQGFYSFDYLVFCTDLFLNLLDLNFPYMSKYPKLAVYEPLKLLRKMPYFVLNVIFVITSQHYFILRQMAMAMAMRFRAYQKVTNILF